MKRGVHALVEQYERQWERRGYPDGIGDEVPERLMVLGLAPSYKAVAVALLRNDLKLRSLGFSDTFVSEWYTAIKRVELAERK